MWDCCRRYQERGILLQPLLTLCLYGWQKEQSLWPWGWTHNCRNGPSSQAFLLHITERDRTGDWGGQGYNLEEIKQRSRVHGTERLILHPDTGRAYTEHCQSLGVSDSGLTSRSCRQPCPCVRVSVCPCVCVRVRARPQWRCSFSIPTGPSRSVSRSSPSTRSPAGGARSSWGQSPQQFLPPHGLCRLRFHWDICSLGHFSLSWCTDCSRCRHHSCILLAEISALTEDVSADPGGTPETLGGISHQWRHW